MRLIAILIVGIGVLQGQTTLRQAAAQRGLPFGAAADADEYGQANKLNIPSYASTLSTQFSMLEPENAMKWDVTQPGQTTFNFEPGDKLVAFAQANHMIVRGHNLCWHQQFPAWLTSYAQTATTAQMSAVLQNHINTVVSHYKGQVFAWDVVNEPFNDPATGVLPDLRNSIWYNQPGIGLTSTGYIEQALRWAHQADPNALLFINDYNLEAPGSKFNALYAMVKDFVSRGVPINGVGFEMHLTLGSYPSSTGLAQNIQALYALGLQVHISEMDVRLQVNSQGVASAADLQSQADQYQRIMTVCLQNPGCTAFQVWGVSDGNSWIPGSFPGFGAALPFDVNYQSKPAFTSLVNGMQTVPPTLNGANIVNAAN
jgi:endo-1,4-beta-xylanase